MTVLYFKLFNMVLFCQTQLCLMDRPTRHSTPYCLLPWIYFAEVWGNVVTRTDITPFSIQIFIYRGGSFFITRVVGDS